MGDAFICRRGGNTFLGLTVISPPTKTVYVVGETADISGASIGANFGTFVVPLDSVAYTYTPTGELTASDTSITVSATVGGRTKSVSIPITVDPISIIFGDNSWDTIARVAAQGNAGNYWSVGDSKTADGITYTIIGMDHDNLSVEDAKYADASYNGNSKKAALTIQVMTAAGVAQMNTTRTNVGGWEQSYMRSTVIPAYLAGMPGDLTAVMRTVQKVTGVGGTDNSVPPATSNDRLFLLCEKESVVGWANSQGLEKNANTLYAYYSGGDRAYKGADEWLRSPYDPMLASDAESFLYIKTGNGDSTAAASYNKYYFPAFCI